MSIELSVLIGFILTLFVYSYLVKDNPLYRIAVHLLVGVSAAYAAVTVFRQVLLPTFRQAVDDPTSLESLLWLVPTVLAVALLFRRVKGIDRLSTLALALMVGVGAAVALTGSIAGTLWPQLTANANDDPIRGILVAVLTACTLFTFHFTGRINVKGSWEQPAWRRGLVVIGRAVLAVTFGALFTGVLNTSLVLLVDRADFYLSQFFQLLP